MVNWLRWSVSIILIILVISVWTWAPRKQFYCHLYCDEPYYGRKTSLGDEGYVLKCLTQNLVVDKEYLVMDEDGFYVKRTKKECVTR